MGGGAAVLVAAIAAIAAIAGQGRDEADRLAVVQGEGLERCGAEGFGDQGVVADLGVGVEGEVVRGQADVRVEEDLQAALERGVDRAWARAPEEAVVDDEQLGILGRGALEQLDVGRDAGGDRVDLGRAWDLEAVGSVVLEAARFEQGVEVGEDVGGGGGHVAKIAVWNTDRASGRGAAW